MRCVSLTLHAACGGSRPLPAPVREHGCQEYRLGKYERGAVPPGSISFAAADASGSFAAPTPSVASAHIAHTRKAFHHPLLALLLLPAILVIQALGPQH